MLEINWTRAIKKDLKRVQHDKSILQELNWVLQQLVACKPLLPRHRDHNLSGNWVDHRECHVKNDLLLIYHADDKNLTLVRLGSHSELF